MPAKHRPRVAARPPAQLPIPAGFRTITPSISVEGGVAALEFYKKAFGARVVLRRMTPDGKVLHARLRFGDSLLMLSDVFQGSSMGSPTALGGSSVSLHLYSADVDRLWSRAVQAGAKISRPLQNQFWGERYGQLIDPFGHHWSLAQPVRMTRAERKVLEEQAMAMFQPAQPPAPEPGTPA